MKNVITSVLLLVASATAGASCEEVIAKADNNMTKIVSPQILCDNGTIRESVKKDTKPWEFFGVEPIYNSSLADKKDTSECVKVFNALEIDSSKFKSNYLAVYTSNVPISNYYYYNDTKLPVICTVKMGTVVRDKKIGLVGLVSSTRRYRNDYEDIFNNVVDGLITQIDVEMESFKSVYFDNKPSPVYDNTLEVLNQEIIDSIE